MKFFHDYPYMLNYVDQRTFPKRELSTATFKKIKEQIEKQAEMKSKAKEQS